MLHGFRKRPLRRVEFKGHGPQCQEMSGGGDSMVTLHHRGSADWGYLYYQGRPPVTGVEVYEGYEGRSCGSRGSGGQGYPLDPLGGMHANAQHFSTYS